MKKVLKKRYYIVFNSCDCCNRQYASESFNKDEVKAEVKKLNSQIDNPYCHYYVGEENVYVKA